MAFTILSSSLTTLGGISAITNVSVGRQVIIAGTTASSSTTTGALTVAGGAGIAGVLSAANLRGVTSAPGAGFIGENVSFTVASITALAATSSYQSFSPSAAVNIPSAGIWLVSLAGAVAVVTAGTEIFYKLTDGTTTIAGDCECIVAGATQADAPIGWVVTYVATGAKTITLQAKTSGSSITCYVRQNTILSATRIA